MSKTFMYRIEGYTHRDDWGAFVVPLTKAEASAIKRLSRFTGTKIKREPPDPPVGTFEERLAAWGQYCSGPLGSATRLRRTASGNFKKDRSHERALDEWIKERNAHFPHKPGPADLLFASLTEAIGRLPLGGDDQVRMIVTDGVAPEWKVWTDAS